MKLSKTLVFVGMAAISSCLASCRDTNPKTPETDMGVTSDTVFSGENDTIDRNYDTKGADTGLDGK